MSAIYTHTVPGYLLKPQHPITINLIGCGGTGSQLLTHLARIDHTLRAGGLGYGNHPGLHVRAFDGDTVTESNIGRQNFAPSDVGQNKAVVLITRINRFYSQNWEAHPYMYDQSVVAKDLHRVNIIITCVDSAKARIDIAKINRNRPEPVTKKKGLTSLLDDDHIYRALREGGESHAYQKQYYWLDLGNSRNSGQVVLGSLCAVKQPEGLAGTVDKLPTILDLFPNIESHDTEEEQGHSCSVAESINSQDLCTNSQMAEWGKKLIWNIFRKMRLETHGVFINLDQMCVNPLPIKNYGTIAGRNHKATSRKNAKATGRKPRKRIQSRKVNRAVKATTKRRSKKG
jgi:PRTRC genetic system ThiF family protein